MLCLVLGTLLVSYILPDETLKGIAHRLRRFALNVAALNIFCVFIIVFL